VYAELDVVDAELGTARPDHEAAVSRLGRVTGALKSAGAFTNAGRGLVASLTALVNSFGQFGEPLRRLLSF
jgi:hypothetical protein